jgi:arylsulfatase A-like enzyme
MLYAHEVAGWNPVAANKDSMKYTWPRFLKTLAAVSLLAVLGLVAFRVIVHLEPRIRMRVDARRNPLVVFVVIDTLRRDHVGTLGYHRATTPNLDRLASEGFVASRMLAHASQTVPSVSSMFTSNAPHAHGVQFDPRTMGFGNSGESKVPLLAEDNLTLAEVLSSEGYFTAAAVDNPWIRREFGFAQGFDQYVESLCLKGGSRVCDGARINKAASKVIQEHAAEKTFLYLHYMDVHHPYAHGGKLPPVFRKGSGRVVYTRGPIDGVSPKNLAYTIDAYDDGVLYTDSLIGELVRELEAAAAERDVLLLITSDHGEEFLEHGGLGHGFTLYPELIETFAIFWRPESRMMHPRDERLSGTMDIAPTLLDLVGVPKPKEMSGRSLLGSSSGGAVIAELAAKKAVIKDDWGLIRDLDTRQDEVVAYSGAHESGPTPALVAELGSLLDSLEIRETPVNSTGPDPALVQQLKALGYIE